MKSIKFKLKSSQPQKGADEIHCIQWIKMVIENL